MKKKKFFAAVLCALLLAVSFSAAEQIKSCYPALGLRWKEPLSQTQAEALRTAAETVEREMGKLTGGMNMPGLF